MPKRVKLVDGGPASRGQNFTIHATGIAYPNDSKLEYRQRVGKRNRQEWLTLCDNAPCQPMYVEPNVRAEKNRKREYNRDDDKDEGLSFQMATLENTPKVMVAVDNNEVTEFDVNAYKATRTGEIGGWMKLARRLQADPRTPVTTEEAIAASVDKTLPTTLTDVMVEFAYAGADTKINTANVLLLLQPVSPRSSITWYYLLWAYAVAKRTRDGEIELIETPITDKTRTDNITSNEPWPVAVQFIMSKKGREVQAALDMADLTLTMGNNMLKNDDDGDLLIDVPKFKEIDSTVKPTFDLLNVTAIGDPNFKRIGTTAVGDPVLNRVNESRFVTPVRVQNTDMFELSDDELSESGKTPEPRNQGRQAASAFGMRDIEGPEARDGVFQTAPARPSSSSSSSSSQSASMDPLANRCKGIRKDGAPCERDVGVGKGGYCHDHKKQRPRSKTQSAVRRAVTSFGRTLKEGLLSAKRKLTPVSKRVRPSTPESAEPSLQRSLQEVRRQLGETGVLDGYSDEDESEWSGDEGDEGDITGAGMKRKSRFLYMSGSGGRANSKRFKPIY